MKTFSLAAAVAVALTLVAGSQASAATATANATAQIVVAISITKTDDLDFGDVAAGDVDGTVIMSPASARSATGGATLVNTGTGNAAAFDVVGEPNATYSISLPTSIVLNALVPNGLAGVGMLVDDFTSNPSLTGELNGSGTQALTVGATLHVGASQPSGTYTNTFDVTVAYN